jgi:hypothetical protein
MEQEKSKRARRTSAEIKKLLEAFSQSGMCAKDFCMLHSISEAGFYKWRTRYVNKPTSKENNFVLLHEASEAKDGSMLFAEVKGIRFYQIVAPSYLKELIS